MSPFMRKALALGPVVFLLLWNLSLRDTAQSGTSVLLPVQGFDPRDMLSGHYLRFQVAWGDKASCPKDGEGQACFCLRPQGPENLHQAERVVVGCRGDAMATCAPYVRGECRSGRFDAGLDRFYFPDDLAKKLGRVPENARIRVKLGTHGQAVIDDMLVGDQSIVAWARAKP